MAKTMLVAAMAASLLAGCGGTGSKDQAGGSDGGAGKATTPASNEPVTVSIVMHEGYFTDQEVQKYFIDPVKKKHPNITIDFKETGKGNEFADFVARNEIPDIFMESIANMGFLEDLGLSLDMEPLIKQHNFDLSRYQKGTVDVLRSLSPKKEINMLAYNRPFFVMYYNKDIFDKFASTYPKDGMTWEDARELAKKVTRMDGGVQYRGLEPNVMNRTASQLNLPYIDEKTGKSAINSDKWKNYLQTMLSIYQIPGNEGYKVNAQAMDQFSKDRILAMLAINNALTKMATMNDMNWDMVSFPTFKEAPGIEPEFSGQTMSIPSTSKHKDAAMEVIMTVTSDEVLTEMSKDGYFVPFTDPKYQKSFAANLTGVQGKNLAAPFKTTPAVPVYHSPIWPKERNLVTNSFAELEKSGMDVNTYLRTYEEKMNALINEANSK